MPLIATARVQLTSRGASTVARSEFWSSGRLTLQKLNLRLCDSPVAPAASEVVFATDSVIMPVSRKRSPPPTGGDSIWDSNSSKKHSG